MKADAIRTVCQEVARRFPEFAGIRPKVQASPRKAGAFQLTFETRVKLDGDKALARWVRVTADENGKIVRMTTSR